MASIDSQIDKPQREHPRELSCQMYIYINTGMQSIDTERASLMELAKIKIKLAKCKS